MCVCVFRRWPIHGLLLSQPYTLPGRLIRPSSPSQTRLVGVLVLCPTTSPEVGVCSGVSCAHMKSQLFRLILDYKPGNECFLKCCYHVLYLCSDYILVPVHESVGGGKRCETVEKPSFKLPHLLVAHQKTNCSLSLKVFSFLIRSDS